MGLNRSRVVVPERRPHVAAALVMDQLKLAEELVGPDVVRCALAKLRPDQRAELDALLPVSWCSLETSQAVFYAVARESGQDPLVWHRRVTRVGVERTCTTLWRFVLRWTSVEAVLKRASLLYSKSYDVGKMTAEEVAPGHVVSTLTDWPTVPDFEIDAMLSGIEVVLHLAGRKQLNIMWKRTPDGARFDVRFQ